MEIDDQAHFHRGHWFLYWDRATDEHRQQLDDYLDWVETLDESERQEAEESMTSGGFYMGRSFRDELLALVIGSLGPRPRRRF